MEVGVKYYVVMIDLVFVGVDIFVDLIFVRYIL